MAITPHPDDLVPHRLAVHPAGADDVDVTYCIENGAVVYRGSVVRHADRDSFVFYANGFAADARAAYCVGRRLVGADPARFRPLNFTWCTDGERVWCRGGEVKGTTASEFQVCDDGRYRLGRTVLPHGYARDRQAVWFYDFSGKARVVRGADPATFESMGDGFFGVDATQVFVDGRRHAKVRRASWRPLGHQYNTDGSAVYFGELRMDAADLASFRVVPSRSGETGWAMDRERRYRYADELRAADLDFWIADAMPLHP
jgi:hypothetical protein